jgi:Pyridoxamine 5'-phosphate oxidase
MAQIQRLVSVVETARWPRCTAASGIGAHRHRSNCSACAVDGGCVEACEIEAAMRLPPQDPTCAKVSLSGKVVEVVGEAAAEAKAMLFSRHPAMATWPTGHDFRA